MRLIVTQVFQIEEHPNREKCYEWIRDNWHDLNEHSVNELEESIKALAKIIGGTYDYSISQVPSIGEHITFKDYDHEELCRLSADDCPLTGVCWDIDLIVGLREGNPRKALDILHKDTEYVYSEEGLFELCQANGYEFKEDGELAEGDSVDILQQKAEIIAELATLRDETPCDGESHGHCGCERFDLLIDKISQL